MSSLAIRYQIIKSKLTKQRAYIFRHTFFKKPDFFKKSGFLYTKIVIRLYQFSIENILMIRFPTEDTERKDHREHR